MCVCVIPRPASFRYRIISLSVLNYSRASVPKKCFRMFVVENALKKTKGMERMRFGLIEEMPSAAKDA